MSFKSCCLFLYWLLPVAVEITQQDISPIWVIRLIRKTPYWWLMLIIRIVHS